VATKDASNLFRSRARGTTPGDRDTSDGLSLQVSDCAPNNGRHRTDRHACDTTAAQDAGENCSTANQVRTDSTQGSTICRRNDGNGSSAGHRLGFSFVHFLRGRFSHHLGESFVVRQFMSCDLMNHFLLTFTLKLRFELGCEFELPLAQGGACHFA
jgi:hypothetical protein